MGLTPLLPDKENLKNCINLRNYEDSPEYFEQHDSHGNIIYYYKRVLESCLVLRLLIYNSDKQEIGSIIRNQNCQCFNYTINDANNNAIYYINNIKGCFSSTYSFLDRNKNLESTINVKLGCTSVIYEQFDKYNTRFRTCERNLYDKEFWTFYEYDQNEALFFKCKKVPHGHDSLFKIFDNYDNEVNLDDKNFLNQGFTKIQIIILIQLMYF